MSKKVKRKSFWKWLISDFKDETIEQIKLFFVCSYKFIKTLNNSTVEGIIGLTFIVVMFFFMFSPRFSFLTKICICPFMLVFGTLLFFHSLYRDEMELEELKELENGENSC